MLSNNCLPYLTGGGVYVNVFVRGVLLGKSTALILQERCHVYKCVAVAVAKVAKLFIVFIYLLVCKSAALALLCGIYGSLGRDIYLSIGHLCLYP